MMKLVCISMLLASSQADMRTLSKAMNDRLEGRGGGSMMMAQGTLKGTREEIRLVIFRRGRKIVKKRK
jgi:hypothetical protein